MELPYRKRKRRSIIDLLRPSRRRAVAVEELRPSRTKGQGRRIFFMILNGILLVPIAVALWYLFASPVYTVQNIAVEGTSAIPTEDVLDLIVEHLHTRVANVIPRNRIWFVTRDGLRDAIEQRFVLQDLRLDKQLPDTLVVHIVERTPAVQWVTDGKKFVVDTQGVVIKELFKARQQQPLFSLIPAASEEVVIPPSEDGYVNVVELANQPAGLSDTVSTPEAITFIRSAYDALAGGLYGDIKAVSVPYRNPQTLVITFTNGDWQLYLNILDTLDAQLSRLSLLVQEKIGRDRLPRLEYIDLKLGESVYYKYKGQ